MPWVLLTIAGLLEIVWAYYMKLSEGFSKPWPTLATFVAMFASFGLLSLAMKQLPLGTSYMVWTGIGALGAFVVGIALLGESVTPMRLVAAAMLLGGLVLMKLAS
ncbi:DMT family transporter [Sphingomonas panni]|uniref:DMT family transporter n=1 Tax=Sphingomonas panni TaxID=237612 RepID=UPI001F5BC908|nr:multidrug efflux SMR transporter [Sphingomonas panni]